MPRKQLWNKAGFESTTEELSDWGNESEMKALLKKNARAHLYPRRDLLNSGLKRAKAGRNARTAMEKMDGLQVHTTENRAL